MKKNFTGLLAMAAMLFATSCSEDVVVSQSTGNEVKVTFTTELRNDVKSRAVGDDTNGIDLLEFAVYDKDGKNIQLLNQDITTFVDVANGIKKATVEVVLVKGQTYSFAFWAQDKDYDAYDFNHSNATVEIDYSKTLNNSREADAFFASINNYTVNGSFEMDVTLKRPFAQVNFLTTDFDLEKAKAAEFIEDNKDYKSSLVINGAADLLHVLDGTVEGNVIANFALNDWIDDDWAYIKNTSGNYIYWDETLKKFSSTSHQSDAEDFKYLATAYFLPINATGDNQITATMTFNGETTQSVELTAKDVLAKRNWRTNIYGNLLTSYGQFNVEITPGFDGEANTEVEDPMTKVVKVANVTELNNALGNSEVGEVVLTDDIEVTETISFGTPANRSTTNVLPGRDFVIDGNGKTLKFKGAERIIDFKKETDGANLTIKNITIINEKSYTERGVNYNTNGTLTLENVIIENADGCSMNYAVCLPSSSDKANVVIKNCTIGSTANTLNVWGENTKIDIINSDLYTVDNNENEGYKVIVLNNNGETSADYSIVNVTGGSLKVLGNHPNGSYAVQNNTPNGIVNISNETEVVGAISQDVVAAVLYHGTDNFYTFNSLQAAITKAIETNGSVRLLKDVENFDADETITIASGKSLEIDLNGFSVAGISEGTGNREMFLVKGTLNVKDGTITIEHEGTDLGWSAMTTIFDVTAGGVLNLSNVVAKNLGGSAMAFVAHLNNWGEVTLNVENSTLESTYIAVRAFNSGYDMNNVTINNSTLKGKYCFWVHNYKAAGDNVGDDSTLNLDLYDGTNTFEYTSAAPILFGFAKPIYLNEKGQLVISTNDELTAALKYNFPIVLNKDAEIQLTDDISLNNTLTIEDATVIIDLNGKTVTAASTSAFVAKAGAVLTLKNGKVVAYESTVRAIGGKAVIESGEYTSTGTALDSLATYRYSLDCREGGELIINGGTFKSNNGMINVGSTVTINGGKFENIVEKSMTRHFAYVSAPLTINNGEFYGKANSSAGGCFFCGAAAGGEITVNGGKFTSLWTSGSVNRIFEYYYGGTITVTGGMFNTNGGIATFVTENTDEATKAAYPYVAKSVTE